MQITMEVLFGIALAIGVPLLGGILTILFQIKNSLGSFTKTLEKAERSLDHNRNEHTKMIGLIESLEKSMNQRMDSIEERIKEEQKE